MYSRIPSLVDLRIFGSNHTDEAERVLLLLKKQEEEKNNGTSDEIFSPGKITRVLFTNGSSSTLQSMQLHIARTSTLLRKLSTRGCHVETMICARPSWYRMRSVLMEDVSQECRENTYFVASNAKKIALTKRRRFRATESICKTRVATDDVSSDFLWIRQKTPCSLLLDQQQQQEGECNNNNDDALSLATTASNSFTCFTKPISSILGKRSSL